MNPSRLRLRTSAEVLNLNLLGFIKGVVWGDIDNDGDQDLYISLLGLVKICIDLDPHHYQYHPKQPLL